MNYYNEWDPYCAQWLRNLIAAGLIPDGVVDERDIRDVRPGDLAGFAQCHFFAGIGGWPLALRMAGWPDDRKVWTGSAPCQPFSAAGQRRGVDDERHLWPAWFDLIRACRPDVVLGEQVDAAAKQGWLDAVFSDLEGEAYACEALVLPACAVGAHHIRKRLWFVAHTDGPGRGEQRGGRLLDGERAPQRHDADGRGALGVAHANDSRQWAGRAEQKGDGRDAARLEPAGFCAVIGVVDAAIEQEGLPGRAWEPRGAAGVVGDTCAPRLSIRECEDLRGAGRRVERRAAEQPSGASDFWSDVEWLDCVDGKRRPTKPGLFPLAHGVPQRVAKLRAIGNAIVPQVGAAFVRAAMVGLG